MAMWLASRLTGVLIIYYVIDRSFYTQQKQKKLNREKSGIKGEILLFLIGSSLLSVSLKDGSGYTFLHA